MMLGALETLYDRTPSASLRIIEAKILLTAFADAFEVDPPAIKGLNADEALGVFREFTAACMEAALANKLVAARYRERLGAKAYRLGRRIRIALAVRPSQAIRVARFFYRGIGIRLFGELPGTVSFGPCSFAQRYTPADCWFMSAFDEGFLRGVSGVARGNLTFSCRLTEGASCCRATFNVPK